MKRKKKVKILVKFAKNIREACTEMAEEVLGRKDKNIRSQCKTVKDLLEAQKKIKLDIEATKDENKKEKGTRP